MFRSIDHHQAILCREGPNFRYTKLHLERQILWHYERKIVNSNSEPQALIRQRAAISRMNNNNKCCRNCESSVPKFTFLINLGA